MTVTVDGIKFIRKSKRGLIALLFLTLVIISVPLIIKAQSQSLEQVEQAWVARYDGGGGDGTWPGNFVLDAAGNTYVTGSSCNTAGTNCDYATVKYDTNGNQLWAARYDSGANWDDATAIAVDILGNVYITGYQTGEAGGGDRSTTVKYDSNGNQLWAVRFYGDFARALSVDSTGNVYVTVASYNYQIYRTIKYNTNGNKLWEVKYGTRVMHEAQPDPTVASSVDTAGNIYIAGNTFNGVTRDFLVVKYDTNGNQLWMKLYDGGSGDMARGISVDDLGNVYVTGMSDGLRGADYATIKYDTNGTQLWAVRYDSGGDDRVSDISTDNSGNVYVTGSDSGGHGNFITVNYDVDGNQLWVARYNGGGRAWDLDIDASGNIYVTGDSTTVKYKSDGTQMWAVNSSGAIGLGVDILGNVYVAGAGFNPLSQSYDYFIIKYIQKPLDSLPPVTTISLDGTLGKNNWYISDVKATLSAIDNEGGTGVEKIEYGFDNQTWQTYNQPFTVSQEGIHQLYYRSTDKAGNVEETKIMEIKIDKTPPETSISLAGTLGENNWYVSDVQVNLSGSDKVSELDKVEYSLDNSQTWQVYTEPSILLSEGINYLLYYSTDQAGNIEETKSVEIKIDKTPPTTKDDYDGLWHKDDFQINLTSSDAISGVNETYYILYQNQQPSEIKKVSSDGQPLIIYQDNDNWLEYWSEGKAGNLEQHQIVKQIKLDKAKPEIEILSPKDSSTISETSFKIEFNALDPVIQSTPSGIASTTALLDGQAVENNQVIDSTTLTGGEHIFSVQATDNAGNQAAQETKFILASPRYLKQTSLEKLKSIQTEQKWIQKQLAQAIKYLTKSLDQNLWLDDWRLKTFFDQKINPKLEIDNLKEQDLDDLFDDSILEKEDFENPVHFLSLKSQSGLKVFLYQYLTVKRLDNLLKQRLDKKQLNPEQREIIQNAIANLTKADELLAQVAIQDSEKLTVQNPVFQKIVDHFLKLAKSELEKGQKISQTKPEKAILHFRRAWLYSQLAARFSQQTIPLPEKQIKFWRQFEK
jgi:hypothetical protein